jgi:hypothetical protein
LYALSYFNHENRAGGRQLKQRLSRWAELSWRERLLLSRSFLVVVATRSALSLCPLPVARRVAAVAAVGATGHTVNELVWAVMAAARYVPEATCLTRALAVHALLGRSGHPSHVEIGVAKESRFEAHAWVVCGEKVVLGADEAHRFCPILVWK